ncbi:hypothetical protein [Kluyvera intermedia]|uniref:hypothetical protein n=1 Tax=Kluyvera intermedia TaxID=61648 RepID=UPI001F5BD083|nr:hypothetical protein [Kluyvera intermedia]
MTAPLPIPKERLEKIASWRETYGAGHNVMLPAEEAEVLARFALNAQVQEPVFYIEVEGDDWIQAGRIPGSTFDFNELPDGINKLYAHPAPSVHVAPAINRARPGSTGATDLLPTPSAPTALPMAPSIPSMPVDLHPDTQKLVADFSTALAEKLYKAQLKYGYSDNWTRDGWAEECLQHFHQHIDKGDPRDVAAYCAFMWYHGWSTALPAPSVPAAVPDGYVLMPLKLTAENGAKYALSGEFHVLHRVTCHECGGEGCSGCDDDGWVEEKIMIGWGDIKDIYRAAVEACSIKSTGEGV